jgi:hypothetical protein
MAMSKRLQLINFNVSTCSNAEPLSRVATSANPCQPPMNRSVTLPADGGGECGFADGMETPPQASRRRSRPGCSTAVASLARHVICAVAARSSHAPAHAAPVQPLSWVCRRPPVGCSLCRFASAAAADPCATLQGGLEREAAVGRRRRECG